MDGSGRQSEQVTSNAFDKGKQSEDQFRTIDAIPVLAWCADRDGSLEILNQKWCDYTGLTSVEAEGWGWRVAVHPDDLNRLEDYWRSALTSGERGEIEARLRRFDGEYRWFLFRGEPLRAPNGEILKWYGTNVDIEDRKRAEERLRLDEAELREIINAIPQGIIVMGLDGTALYANQATLDYTGNIAADFPMIGCHERFTHPDDAASLRAQREEGIARGKPFQLEQRIPGKDGRHRWFLVHYNPLRDEQGKILRWYATGTNIEHRKQAEDRVKSENLSLREELDHSLMFEEIVGSSEPLRQVLAHVTKVAPSDSTVLILGETGTGKELIARAIHKRSKRSARAFVRVNCAAIPTSLLASELFGHEKGAFTGAMQRRLGRFESAEGGTIFLDEIGELPAETQIALLRVLQEREFERVGGGQPIPLDVRVLAATNRDLKTAIAGGTFRQDLFYRLNVFPIQMPSLRERADDIPLLVEYLIDRYGKKAGKKIQNISKRTLEFFQAYDWPGNIRELQNVIERAVVLCDGTTFTVDEAWLKRENPQTLAPAVPLVVAMVNREREIIEAALEACRGRVYGPKGAAAKLGIPRQTLESKIAGLRIDRHQFKSR